jgi:hypothetical protein
LRIGVDTRLRILQNTNGAELRFRAQLSEGRTPLLEVVTAVCDDVATLHILDAWSAHLEDLCNRQRL